MTSCIAEKPSALAWMISELVGASAVNSTVMRSMAVTLVVKSTLMSLPDVLSV